MCFQVEGYMFLTSVDFLHGLRFFVYAPQTTAWWAANPDERLSNFSVMHASTKNK